MCCCPRPDFDLTQRMKAMIEIERTRKAVEQEVSGCAVAQGLILI